MRSFRDTTFRTKNALVLTMDLWQRGGRTLVSCVYFERGEPGPDGEVFCTSVRISIAICRGGGFRAFSYLKSPTDIEFEASAPGIAPRA